MSKFEPDLYYSSVTAVDVSHLRSIGITTLLLDIDNTILPRDTGLISPIVESWAEMLLSEGFKVALVSNNWHDHVKRIADGLGFGMVSKALKPLPWGFLRAMRLLGSSRGATAIIGDQLFTDILGGNMLGLTTVLVPPLSQSDLPHTLVLRRIERRLLAGRQPLA